MSKFKTSVTTLFLMVLCYGVTVPTVSNIKKNVVTTVKKDK
jgi:hypothetical protein